MGYKIDGACLNVEFSVMGPIENNVYIIDDGKTAFVVDPTCDSDAIISQLGKRKLAAIVLTHRHWDHVGAASALRRKTGAITIATAIEAPYIEGTRSVPGERHEAPPCIVDHQVSHGDIVQIGDMPWKVIGTPGHTPGGMCLYIDPRFGCRPEGAPLLVSGDTLFYGTIGRTDFQGGDLGQMKQSLKRLAVLRDETIVLPGHGSITRIGDERQRVFARYADDEPGFGSADDKIVTA